VKTLEGGFVTTGAQMSRFVQDALMRKYSDDCWMPLRRKSTRHVVPLGRSKSFPQSGVEKAPPAPGTMQKFTAFSTAPVPEMRGTLGR
jgi:hypothetical protein